MYKSFVVSCTMCVCVFDVLSIITHYVISFYCFKGTYTQKVISTITNTRLDIEREYTYILILFVMHWFSWESELTIYNLTFF